MPAIKEILCEIRDFLWAVFWQWVSAVACGTITFTQVVYPKITQSDAFPNGKEFPVSSWWILGGCLAFAVFMAWREERLKVRRFARLKTSIELLCHPLTGLAVADVLFQNNSNSQRLIRDIEFIFRNTEQIRRKAFSMFRPASANREFPIRLNPGDNETCRLEFKISDDAYKQAGCEWGLQIAAIDTDGGTIYTPIFSLMFEEAQPPFKGIGQHGLRIQGVSLERAEKIKQPWKARIASWFRTQDYAQ